MRLLTVPLFFVVGIMIGAYIPILIPAYYVKYLSVAVLAGMDSVFGGVRAHMENSFSSLILISGFFMNALLAAGLAYMGDVIGVALYMAAVIAFGVRSFDNLAIIRRYVLSREKGC